MSQEFCYNFNVDWGDSSFSSIKSYHDENKYHNYKNPGEYEIKIQRIIRRLAI